MEFWGVEVKSGEPLEVVPGFEMLVHISQVTLGEGKKDKGNESVCLYANIGSQKLVLGTLSAEKFPHISLDLVFEKKFELSHNWKNGSVYFCGYKAPNPGGYLPTSESSDTSFGSDSGFEIDIQRNATVDNGKPQQLKQEKPDSAAAKQKVMMIEPSKDAKPKENDDVGDKDDDESTDDDDESTDDDDESSEDEDIISNGSASSEDEDDDEDDKNETSKNKETPKKAGPSKKRPAESVSKTPVPDKKAKFVTPKKTDGKKSDDKKGGVHVATPYPSKPVGKTPANTEKSKQLVLKSGGSFSCKSCNRSFNSENALQSHTKAKHSASK